MPGAVLSAAADAEASWGTGAARSVPDPFLPLTRWERRYAELLCGTGLDGYSAHLVALDYRRHGQESPWWPLIEPWTALVEREWRESLGYERGGQRVCPDPFGLRGPATQAAGGWQ